MSEIQWYKARNKPIVRRYRVPIPNCNMKIFKEDGTIVGEVGMDDNTEGYYYKCQQMERIETLEGEEYAIPGIDYVIEGVEGELYPCKIRVFLKTYDELGQA